MKHPHGESCEECGDRWPCVAVQRAASPALRAVENLTPLPAPSPQPETCGVLYDRHPTQPHLSAVCTRPASHAGGHSNVLHKPGQDPDRAAPSPQPEGER